MLDTRSELIKKLQGISFDVPLSQYTTFRVGGSAKYFYIARNNAEVVTAVKVAQHYGVPFTILGGGSNILVSDQGLSGLVIKMENCKIEINETNVTAESGAKLQKVARKAIEHKLSGMEFLISIPGTLGGAITGNAGTSEEWIGSIIESVDIVNHEGKTKSIPKSQCDFSYRSSRFKGSDYDIIVGAVISLRKLDSAAIQDRINRYLEKRKHQPTGNASIGSIFINPIGEKAWEVIDRAGLRGKKIGGAQVSEKHANYIINTGNATAEDILILVSYIKQQVRDQLGIQLQEEFQYVGFAEQAD